AQPSRMTIVRGFFSKTDTSAAVCRITDAREVVGVYRGLLSWQGERLIRVFRCKLCQSIIKWVDHLDELTL
ncbi:hypothetical protein, partial [Caballeronia sordidicola]|uniref:hypothetical protein n=1 Tax=Caballeronia sordidicola TaxID=196367 RepID=UPI001C4FF544